MINPRSIQACLSQKHHQQRSGLATVPASGPMEGRLGNVSAKPQQYLFKTFTTCIKQQHQMQRNNPAERPETVRTPHFVFFQFQGAVFGAGLTSSAMALQFP